MCRSFAVGGSRAMRGRLVRIVSLLLLIPWGPAPALAQQEDEPTRVVILGVGHSTQLVVEVQRSAALRAFFDRVAPDVIAVERSPEGFARGDHHEFTYEIQHLALPYAHERGLPVYPIDWIPSEDDMLLGFGVDLEVAPFLRGGGQSVLAFPDPDETDLPLFFADSAETRLLAVRLGVLTGEVFSQEAIAAYGALSRGDPGATGFGWNGVQDPSRLDSYFDPFGNPSVPERARVELAREQHELGRVDAGDAVLKALESEFPPRKAVQLRAYRRERLVGGK